MDKKIFLLADDDADDTEMFSEALERIDNSIICHCVTDGREALKKLDELIEKPNVIFLDVNMPVMNGWQCLQLLKENNRYDRIPVIIMSTSSHQRDIDIAANLGAFCYFIKPNDYNELRQVLEAVVASIGEELANALQSVPANISKFIHGCNEGSKQG